MSRPLWLGGDTGEKLPDSPFPHPPSSLAPEVYPLTLPQGSLLGFLSSALGLGASGHQSPWEEWWRSPWVWMRLQGHSYLSHYISGFKDIGPER